MITALLISFLLIALTIAIHYEVLRFTSNWIVDVNIFPRARMILVLALAMVSHLVARRYDGLVRCFRPPDELSNRLWLLVSPQAQTRPAVRRLLAFSTDRIAERVRALDRWPDDEM